MGTVRLMKSAEIGLRDDIQLFEDGLRTGKESGNYEWWYFDSKYEDGSSLVIVFFTKPVTSLAGHFQPEVILDYVHPDGREVHTKYTSSGFSTHVSDSDC